MPDNPHVALANYRLEKAEDCYLAAQKLLESGLLRDSANRSYYAIFHAVRAVLALDEVDFKKHSAVISYFQQYYIKEKKFDVHFSNYVRDAFSVRQQCDYDDFFVIADREVELQLHHARELLDAVSLFLKKQP